MKKSGYNNFTVTVNKNIELQNISSISIANYGATDLTVFGRTLPAYSEANGASQFVIEGDGTYSDLTFDIVFADGSGKAIIDYRKIITENC